jgi:hypothetical protein
MATKIFTKADLKSWDGAKKDVLDSIQHNFDELFTKAHLVKMVRPDTPANTSVTLYFDSLAGDRVETTAIVIPVRLFDIIENK